MLEINERITGCLFGAAFGDALAAPNEFMNFEKIIRVYGPDGPDLNSPLAQVTDDTQMMLAVGEALAAATRPFNTQTLEPVLREAFVTWYSSPENNRAPGMTCLKACKALSKGIEWHQASVLGSKGCGANMRVQPVGILKNIDESTRAGIAQFQAALTHGHPTALAAADLTSSAIAYLIRGEAPTEIVPYLRGYAHSQHNVYHEGWLGELWQLPGATTPTDFISRGWDECLAVLDNLERALANPDYDADPCLATGAGWIAEEAFGTGLFCFLLFPDNPVKAIRRAAVTSGDSDSIACLAGSFAGAYAGLGAWPSEWIQRIEYQHRLAILSTELSI